MGKKSKKKIQIVDYAAAVTVVVIREWVLCDGTMPAPATSWGSALEKLRGTIATKHPELSPVHIVDASVHIRGRRCIANFRNAVKKLSHPDYGFRVQKLSHPDYGGYEKKKCY